MTDQAATKNVTVVNAGTGQYNDLGIRPGTTAGDILQTIGLPDYRLSKAGAAPFAAADSGRSHDAVPTQNLYEHIRQTGGNSE